MTIPIAQAPGKTDADKLTILKLLAGGRDVAFVAAALDMTRDDVILAATPHGYPDVQKMAWAVDVLQKRIDDDLRTGAPAPSGRPPVPLTRPAPRPDHRGQDTPAAVQTTAALIARGKKSEKAATRRLAEKTENLLAQLDAAVREEETAKREAAERAAAEARVRSEIARLEAELAAKRALLGGPARKTSRASQPTRQRAAFDQRSATQKAGLDSKTVRGWAHANGVECPRAGKVPQAVVDAYLAAHTQQGAA